MQLKSPINISLMICFLLGFFTSHSEAQSFNVKYEDDFFVLRQKESVISKVQAKGNFVHLVADAKGKLSLRAEKNTSKIDASRLLKFKQPIQAVSTKKFEFNGTLKGKSYYTSDLEKISYEGTGCQGIQFVERFGQILIIKPVPPVIITMPSNTITLSRENVVEFDLKPERPVYLVNCPEQIGAGQVAMVDGGNLSIVILIDNIIDPDAYFDAGMPDQMEIKQNLSREIKLMNSRKVDGCVDENDPKWQSSPVAVVDMNVVGTQMEIRCNRYLFIHTPDGDVCIDLVSCGAKISKPSENGNVIEIRSGCQSNPSQGCPQ